MSATTRVGTAVAAGYVLGRFKQPGLEERLRALEEWVDGSGGSRER